MPSTTTALAATNNNRQQQPIGVVFCRALAVGPSMSLAVPISGGESCGDLLTAAMVRSGARGHMRGVALVFQGRELPLHKPLCACGVRADSTVHIVGKLLGGKPVKVTLLTPAPCGPSVTVDVEADTPLWEMKLQLQDKTGVPVEHQKVMLEGVGRICMGDKRASLGYTHSASTGSLYLGLLGSDEPQPKA